MVDAEARHFGICYITIYQCYCCIQKYPTPSIGRRARRGRHVRNLERGRDLQSISISPVQVRTTLALTLCASKNICTSSVCVCARVVSCTARAQNLTNKIKKNRRIVLRITNTCTHTHTLCDACTSMCSDVPSIEIHPGAGETNACTRARTRIYTLAPSPPPARRGPKTPWPWTGRPSSC